MTLVITVFCKEYIQCMFFSHQHCLGFFSGGVASLICRFGWVSSQGFLYAAFVLWTASDVTVVRVFRDDLFLSFCD